MQQLLLLGVLFLIGLLPSRIFAAAMDFELLDPNPAPQGGLTLQAPQPITGLFSVGGYLHQQRSPVIFGRNGGAKSIDRLVSHRLQLRAVAALNVLDYAQVALDLPLTLASGVKLNNHRTNVTTLNDPLLKLKAPFFTLNRAPLRYTLGAALDLQMALGEAENFAGSNGRFIQPTLKLLGELDRQKWQLRATLGWRERERTVLDAYQLAIDDLLLFRFGYALNTQLGRTWFFEYAGSTAMAQAFSNVAHDANELILGWQIPWHELVFTPAASVGLSKAFGVPTWRVLFSVFWQAPQPQPLSSVEIIVQDQVGQPLAGVNVKLASASGEKQAISDRNGLVRFSRLKSGQAEVSGQKIDFHPSKQLLTLVAGQKQSFTLTMHSALTRVPLSIFVYDAQTKLPLAARVDLTVQMGTRREILALASAADGITHASVIPGVVNVTARTEGYQVQSVEFNLAKGQDFQIGLPLEKDFASVLAAGAAAAKQLSRVSFEFVDSVLGKPISDITITSPLLGVFDRSQTHQWSLVVQPGKYEFIFSSDTYFPAKVSGELTAATNERHHVVQFSPRGKELVVVGASEIYITEKIFFATGSARILAKSFAVLDALVKVLNEHLDIRKVLIKGHTDNIGKRANNIALSRDRAKAVQDYLIAKGVLAERLAFEGYGPDQPLADNASEEGRAINRRVEFEILQRGAPIAPTTFSLAATRSQADFTDVVQAGDTPALGKILLTKLMPIAQPQAPSKAGREKIMKYAWNGPTGVLSLRVLNEATGQPPLMALLGFNAGEKAGGILRRKLDSGGAIDQELPPGKVLITVGAPGFYPTVQEAEIVEGETTTLQIVIRPLTLELEAIALESDKSDLADVDAAKNALINVAVLDFSTGKPVPQANLYLTATANSVLLQTGVGSFELVAGQHVVGITAAGYHGVALGFEVEPGEYDAKVVLAPVQAGFKVAKFDQYYFLSDDRVFVMGESKLSSEGRASIAAFAKYLTANTEVTPLTVEVQVINSQGQSDHKMALARAESIAAALIAGGVSPQRLHSYAPESPVPLVVPHHSAAARLNNRVVFYIGQPKQAVVFDAQKQPLAAQESDKSNAATKEPNVTAEDLLKDLRLDLE